MFQANLSPTNPRTMQHHNCMQRALVAEGGCTIPKKHARQEEKNEVRRSLEVDYVGKPSAPWKVCQCGNPWDRFCACMHTDTLAHVHACTMHTCAHARSRAHIHTHKHINTGMQARTHPHGRLSTHTHLAHGDLLALHHVQCGWPCNGPLGVKHGCIQKPEGSFLKLG